MDVLRDIAVIAGLFGLRVGVPLIITLVIGHLLARLDARWQTAELGRRAKAEASSRAIEPPRCWEINGCNPGAREKCPAYQLRPLPCWLAFRKLQGRLPERCFGCPVFAAA